MPRPGPRRRDNDNWSLCFDGGQEADVVQEGTTPSVGTGVLVDQGKSVGHSPQKVIDEKPAYILP